MNTPFFIVGPQRSGTTLLRLMLSSHPRIIVPPESHFVPDLINWEKKVGSLSIEKEKVINWLINHKRLDDFEFSKEDLYKLLFTLSPFTAKNIVTAIFELYTKRNNKVRWGDKTPRYRAFIPDLLELFPGAKFIFMLRDGRDTALSNYNVPFGPRFLGDCAYLWKKSIAEAWAGLATVPKENYLLLKYEELINNPENTLAQLCEFLGEKYYPQMLAFYRDSSGLVPKWENTWHSKTHSPLDKNSVGKWKRELTSKQIKLIEILISDELLKHGYQLSELSLSFPEKCWVAKEILLFALVKFLEMLRPRKSRIGDRLKD